MLKTIPRDRLYECLRDAAASPMVNPAVSYPDWYLQRWHFLPEGYISRRSTRLYSAYVPQLYNQRREKQLMSIVAKDIAKPCPRRVLELGCGPGKALAAVARRLSGASLTGLDLSPFFLEMARDNPTLLNAEADLLHGDAVHLPWEEGTFDAVFAIHLFGHMPAEHARAALAESARVLEPGGRLLTVDHAWHAFEVAHTMRLLGTKSFNFGLIRVRILERE